MIDHDKSRRLLEALISIEELDIDPMFGFLIHGKYVQIDGAQADAIMAIKECLPVMLVETDLLRSEVKQLKDQNESLILLILSNIRAAESFGDTRSINCETVARALRKDLKAIPGVEDYLSSSGLKI
jgi:hypothetical protein